MNSNSTYTAGESVFRRWNFLGFGYRRDVIAGDYMRRWTFYTPIGMVRVHHIMRSDNDRHFHDHPFDFVSLILRGGYLEHRPGKKQRMFLPGDFVVRRAEEMHYLTLLGRDAWTLVFASKPRRRWGFATEDGWIDAAEYDDWLLFDRLRGRKSSTHEWRAGEVL